MKDYRTNYLKMSDLMSVKRVLDKLNVPFFIEQGTCLGAVRDGDFIEGDRDIDLGIFRDDMQHTTVDIIRDNLLLEGFRRRITYNEGYAHEDRKNICVDRNTLFDIHIYFLASGNSVPEFPDGYYTEGMGVAVFPAKYKEMAGFYFRGIEFRMPKLIEEYLVWSFGNDWRIKSDDEANGWNYFIKKKDNKLCK